jgi:hypothetical protein
MEGSAQVRDCEGASSGRISTRERREATVSPPKITRRAVEEKMATREAPKRQISKSGWPQEADAWRQ